MPKFTHLHLHSHYSLLDGAGKIDEIIARVKELGMDSVALTDHGVMYGTISFFEKANKQGIKPIIGVEGYIAPRSRFDKTPHVDNKPYHIVLLAENNVGYQNLLKITSEAHLNGYYYKPRIDKEYLAHHHEGLIATSACSNGEIARQLNLSWDEACRSLEEYLQIFGPDNFFLEIQRHPEDPNNERREEITRTYEQIVKLAKEFSVPIIATNDVHYVYREDAEAQDVLTCIASGKLVTDRHRLDYRGLDLSIRSPEEMIKLFADLPEAIENTQKISQRCQVSIPMGQVILPDYPLPAGRTVTEELRQLCFANVPKRYHFNYQKIQEWSPKEILPPPQHDENETKEQRVAKRLEYELSVIEYMGFEGYFLIVADFIEWARQQNILIGPGRGSAAGSIVSYLTGITDIDPLSYNLIFERFLNPERISMPDIDTDIMDARRDEVIDYVRQKYGHDHVAQIITFGTMLARNAVRDVGRVLAFSYQECDYLAKLIPFGNTLKNALETVEELSANYRSNERIKKLLDLAQKVEGVARHTSVHAAGVVISKKPLTEYLPIQYAVKDEKTITTQYAMNEVERLGLLKMDFLGLANLNIIQRTLEIIEAIHSVKIDIRNIATDDRQTYKLLSRAETTGVFQLESAGMKRYLKELQPTEFEDIISMVALYRPGPMESIPAFIEAKHGRQKINYLHPILEPILAKTYGFIVTQDQVLEIAREFAGFSYGEADVLRKAVGKKIKKLLDEQREKFIRGAVSKKGIDELTANQVWDFIEPFARYGFNRAHAACYAMIAYQTAYLKAHYPVEFMAALLTSDLDNLDRIGIEISECHAMGIEVLPPDVNKSFVDFGVVKKQPSKANNKQPTECTCQKDSLIYFGLAAIKNVGADVARKIVRNRKEGGPFKDFSDFLVRLGTDTLNKKVLENLAKSGALDSLAEREQVLANMDKILAFIQATTKQKNSSQERLFGEEIDSSVQFNLNLELTTPATSKTKLAWEKELLGIYLSDHPIKHFASFIPQDSLPLFNIKPEMDGQTVRVAGIVTKSTIIMTKNNQPMAFVLIEDQSTEVELIVFPRIFEISKDLWQEGQAVLVDGIISSKDSQSGGTTQEAKILVNQVWRLGEGTEKIPAVKKKNNSNSSSSANNHSSFYARSRQPAATPSSMPRAGNQNVLNIILPEGSNKNLLFELKDIFSLCPGETPVVLSISQNGHTKVVRTKARVRINSILIRRLTDLIGRENIIL